MTEYVPPPFALKPARCHVLHMRRYTTPSPRLTQCNGCGKRMSGRAATCDECTRKAFVPDDKPCCAAPECTRAVGMAETLCPIHIAIAAGEPPRLTPQQYIDAIQYLGDPEKAMLDAYEVRVPGIGHVKMIRRRLELESGHHWWEWATMGAKAA